jgi:phosphoglycolate phosphatase-like HAD superfamily hydrolase
MRYRALATDYDGPIANDKGVVDTTALAALERLRGSGRHLILVTGRSVTDLQQVMPRLDLFSLVVAEDGALLYDPAKHEEQALGIAPPLPSRCRQIAPTLGSSPADGEELASNACVRAMNSSTALLFKIWSASSRPAAGTSSGGTR